MPFPIEIITMLGSGALGGLLKLMGMKADLRRIEHELLLDRATAQRKSVSAARQFKGRGFQWTRRTIALTGFLSIIVLPKIALIFGLTDVPIMFGWTEWESGFLFFSDGRDTWQWREVEGLVITPLDTHVISAILGLYFGGSLVEHNRR